VLALVFFAAPAAVLGQTDEIQVYNAEIEEPGAVNLLIHTNYTSIGRKTADYPGGIVPNQSVNSAAEWAYGVCDWFEQGLYMPLYSSYSQGRGATINGFKLRELFVRPHAHDHTFFYGINFEFGVNARYWKARRISSEVRPIMGLHLHPVDFIFNPIVDTAYAGGIGGLEFVPATRLAWNFNDKWAASLEEYADLGQLNRFVSPHSQFHEIWAVMNYNGKVSVETGVGVGLTAASDRLTFKLMVSRDLISSSRRRP